MFLIVPILGTISNIEFFLELFIFVAYFSQFLFQFQSTLCFLSRLVAPVPKMAKLTVKQKRIIYFPPSATSSMQPLDGGAFCWIQDRYRNWLNTYLIENEEKPPKLPMIETVYKLIETLPKNIILASYRRCQVKVSSLSICLHY